jgi:hypothetical protein
LRDIIMADADEEAMTWQNAGRFTGEGWLKRVSKSEQGTPQKSRPPSKATISPVLTPRHEYPNLSGNSVRHVR